MFLSGMGTSSPEMHLLDAHGREKSIPVRQQMKLVAQDMGKRTWGSAKSFGKIASIYSASECVIEGVCRIWWGA